MKASIITVSFNSSTTIANCLDSVVNQILADVEYILVDGGSTDDTLEIIKKYKGGIASCISEPDKGIYDAMNKGIKMATGEIIGILNSDDLFATNDILQKVEHVFTTTNADLVYGNIEFFRENPENVVRKWDAGERKSFLTGWHPPHPGLFVKREVYENYGLFDDSFQYSADFEFMLRVFEKHELTAMYLNETLVKMRIGGATTGSLKAIVDGNKEIRRAFKQNGFEYPPFYSAKRYIPKLKEYIIGKF